MTRNLLKLWAFVKRDFLSEISYRLAFVMQVGGMFFSLLAFSFLTGMIDPNAEGFRGMKPFDWMLIGLAFQFYFSTALYAFSAKIRQEQLIGTLEAMLVSPTPTSMVIFSSAAWNFTYGGIRMLIYLIFAVTVFDVTFHFSSPTALLLGVLLTLLSSAGLGILSASFILYFKRGDPVNFLLSAMTTFFGNVFFPVEQLPDWAEWISDYIPVNWSMRVVRGVLLENKPWAELSGDVLRLAILTAILLPAGLIASRIAIRRAKRVGSLVQY